MFRTLSLCSLLAFSLTCLAQVTSTGGYATTSGPAIGILPFNAANAPITSTPDIALPGSGPAIGVPLGSSNTNDSRVSTGASVSNRNYINAEPAVSNVTAQAGVSDTGAAGNGAAATSSTTAQTGNIEAYNMGIQHFESGLQGKAAATPSLAELARQVRSSQHPATRVINNDTIAELNARGATTGNIPIGSPANNAGTSTEAANAAPAATTTTPQANGTLMARNQPPPFSPAQSQQAAPPPSPTAGQQRHTADQNTAAAPQSNTADQNAMTTDQPAGASNNKGLPQTGSYLPLLFLIGVIGVGGGAIYFLRR